MNQQTLDLIQKLELQPHPEGGHYREVYRSEQTVLRHADEQERLSLTTIYFLLATGELSRWHVVASDEVWHFYEGDDLELFIYDPVEQKLSITILGHVTNGHSRVAVVPAGHWQAARPVATSKTGTLQRLGYSLVGCTVGPGFEFADFRFVSDIEKETIHFEEALNNYRDML